MWHWSANERQGWTTSPPAGADRIRAFTSAIDAAEFLNLAAVDPVLNAQTREGFAGGFSEELRLNSDLTSAAAEAVEVLVADGFCKLLFEGVGCGTGSWDGTPAQLVEMAEGCGRQAAERYKEDRSRHGHRQWG